jgi:hypothetical protein
MGWSDCQPKGYPDELQLWFSNGQNDFKIDSEDLNAWTEQIGLKYKLSDIRTAYQAF